MPNFASSLKDEIARISKKSHKQGQDALKVSLSRHRNEISFLKKKLSSLENAVKRLEKVGRVGVTTPAQAGSLKLRFRMDGFITLRKKLGISAEQMGTLLGVSAQSVYKWERGDAKPRAAQVKKISLVRGLGKKEALARLRAAG
jgi:DNA-binding transcriptional regulator YiaG